MNQALDPFASDEEVISGWASWGVMGGGADPQWRAQTVCHKRGQNHRGVVDRAYERGIGRMLILTRKTTYTLSQTLANFPTQ